MRFAALIGSVAVLALGLAAQTAWAEGDPALGEKVFNRCKVCHTIDEGGAPKQGPNLFGVYGRAAGSTEPGSLDSGKLPESGIVWDETTLAEWLAGPSKFIPGVKMTFRVTKEEDVANVIAYLKENSPGAE